MKRFFPVYAVSLVTFFGLIFPSSSPAEGQASLFAVYEKMKGSLVAINPYGAPVHVESEQMESRIVGRVFGLLDHDIQTFTEVFSNPAHWGEIVTLHLNVKCFIVRRNHGKSEITFYLGRKYYEPPEKAHKLRLDYRVDAITSNYLKVCLTGGKGPLGTRDYLLSLEAIPVGENRSFVCFAYAYGFGAISKMAISAYLRTLGREKIGFSIVGTDTEGSPIHTRGMRGIIERNAMRYYLAVKAYLDTLRIPEKDRFEKRLNLWFDLTERYHAQLYEYDRKYYLACKKRERKNRVRLQKCTDAMNLPATTGVCEEEPLPSL